MYFLIGVLVLVGVGVFGYLNVVSKVKRISRECFGTDDISKIAKELQEQESNTPKSVSGMTSIYLPLIVKDFPDFEYNEMKKRAETMLLTYLHAIDTQEVSELKYANEELRAYLENYIDMLRSKDLHEKYELVRIHQTELCNYRREAGKCIVTFQTSLQCMHYSESQGELISGSRENRYQTRYNIDMVYVQDRDKVIKGGEKALGINCPNCGAPIKAIGKKYCDYCGAGIEEINVKAWSFSAVEEKHR